MAVDFDELFISDKVNKVIYSPAFGFVRIICFPKKITVQYDEKKPLGTTPNYGYGYGYEYGYSTRTKEVKWDDIYVVSPETVNENGRKSTKHKYEKFSFNIDIKSSEFLAVKIGEKYYKLFNDIFRIRLYPGSSLANAFFMNSNDVLSIKKRLESVEWKEDEDNQTINVSNIKQLTPGTKVFVDGMDGGEGEIVRIKELSVVSKTAIFEIKLYNGKSVKVDYFEQGSQSPIIKLIVPNTYKPNSEISILNESMEELQLNPFVRTMTNGFNIYWQPVEKAASYTVELYTWNESSVVEKLYKLESRTVERNQCYCVFSSLAIGKYYVRVIAEDRAGARIAVNRAIIVEIR